MTAPPDGTRLAVPGDEETVFQLLVEMHVEEKSAPIPVRFAQLFDYDYDASMEVIRAGTRGERGVIGLVSTPQGCVVGTCGLMRERWWWTKSDEFMSLVWIFVRATERRHGYEKRLFEFIEWVRSTMEENLRERGSDKPMLIEAGFQRFDRMEARERLWRRNCGGEKSSVGFLLGLHGDRS